MKQQKENKSFWLLLILILIGAALRIFAMQHFGWMHDELSAISRLRFSSFHDLIQYGVKPDGHPAGVQVFLWLWAKWFGTAEWVLRLPFLLLGIANIYIMYKVVTKVSTPVAALFAAAFVALSPYTILYSTIIRPYIAGLFFVLWATDEFLKIYIDKDFTIKTMIGFALSLALAAYTHYFAMLQAFAIGLVGLLLVENKKRYLLLCLSAVLLFLPHIPILWSQMQLKGVGEWLDAPTWTFGLEYGKYLCNFSWILTATMIVCAICLMNNFKGKWNLKWWSLSLFLLAPVVGFVYSITVNPVLQYSCLLFSLPFLLLFLSLFVDRTLSKSNVFLLSLFSAVMIFSLIVERQYFQVAKKQWYELSYKTVLRAEQQYGSENVVAVINTEKYFLQYYEHKYCKVNNIVDKDDNLSNTQFQQIIQHLSQQYIVVAGISDTWLEIVKQSFPIVINRQWCYNGEVYLCGKTGRAASIEPPYFVKEGSLQLTDQQRNEEYVHLCELALDSILKSRYGKMELRAWFENTEQIDLQECLLVMELRDKQDRQLAWRAEKCSDYFDENTQQKMIFLPFRYETILKNDAQIHNKKLIIYLWNKNQQEFFKNIKYSLSIENDNNFIYGLTQKNR